MGSALSYQDVYLVPRYSELRSRSQADLSVKFLGRKFAAPWIPANMESVINEDIAHWLSENDYPYIFHRFGDTLAFVEKANQTNLWKLISISVGVKEEDKNLLREIAARGLRVDWITIDVANGHHILVKEMIEFIKGLDFKSVWGDYVHDSVAIREGIAGRGRGLTSIPLSYQPKIIAGNVATPKAVQDLAEWGADAIKCGVGGGAACSTKNMTAFHVPMFTCAQDCAERGGGKETDEFGFVTYDSEELPSPVPLILDGGVRENGDIAKALVAANGVPALVMAGSLFAACVNAPGENIYSKEQIDEANSRCLSGDGYREYVKRFIPIAKSYHGSASHIQKGERKHVEGIQIEIPCNGLTYAEKYQELKESLASSVSYAGGNSLAAFRGVKWVSLK